MTVIRHQVRPGAYHDSIVLMQLRASLAALPGVVDAAVVMATEANLDLLRQGDLLPPRTGASPEDLLVVVRGEEDGAVVAALEQVDSLLARRPTAGDDEYRPRSLDAAAGELPQARWVAVSVPGRYAAEVCHRALDLQRSVFLFSDNVALEDEVALKERAHGLGLLMLGPDCGTARVGGVGMGFANRGPTGPVAVVGASGTGLQVVTTQLHHRGVGVSHALGTGGRDLTPEVEGRATAQLLDLLARDEETKVIVVVSKPPDPAAARRVLGAARATGKPVVVAFLGLAIPGPRVGNLHFAPGLAAAVEIAADLVARPPGPFEGGAVGPGALPTGYVRGLFSGGTLAYECLLQLRPLLAPLRSNLALPGVEALGPGQVGPGHAVLDLGADELTVGRAHPMMDLALLRDTLRRQAACEDVVALLFDVVLGDGAHPDPAGELGPVLADLRQRRPALELVAVVVGSDDDPQDRVRQVSQLEAAGARVFPGLNQAVGFLVERCLPAPPLGSSAPATELLRAAEGVLNVGLEVFAESLREQGFPVVHVDWRPPARGNERLAQILRKMR